MGCGLKIRTYVHTYGRLGLVGVDVDVDMQAGKAKTYVAIEESI